MTRRWQVQVGALAMLVSLSSGCPGANKSDDSGDEMTQPMTGGMNTQEDPDAGTGGTTEQTGGSMETPVEEMPDDMPEGPDPTGFVFVGQTPSTADFESCDLTAVDWDAIVPPEVDECEDDFCQTFTSYSGPVIYTDLDGDGLEEAWLSWYTDITGDFASVTMSHLTLYTRDQDCVVSSYTIHDGVFEWITLTALTDGVRVVLDDLGTVVSSTVYVYGEEGLREAVAMDWQREDGARLVPGEFTELKACYWAGFDWLKGIGATWATFNAAMSCDSWSSMQNDVCHDFGGAGTLTVDFFDANGDGELDAAVTTSRFVEDESVAETWLLTSDATCSVLRYPLASERWASMGASARSGGLDVHISADATPSEVREFTFESGGLFLTRSYWEVDSIWDVDGVVNCDLRAVDWDAVADTNQANVESVSFLTLDDAGREGAFVITRSTDGMGAQRDLVSFYAAEESCQVYEAYLTSGDAGSVTVELVDDGADVRILTEMSAEPTGSLIRYRWLEGRLVRLQ